MSEAVTVALIAAFQAITVAIGAPWIAHQLGRIRKDAAASLDQLANSHGTNLREENDDRHAQTLRAFAEVRKDIGGLRADIRDIGGRLATLERLEITNPRPKGRTPR